MFLSCVKFIYFTSSGFFRHIFNMISGFEKGAMQMKLIRIPGCGGSGSRGGDGEPGGNPDVPENMRNGTQTVT